jgi:glutamate racemase
MIGVFDSGHGGLTIQRALAARLPDHDFLYYGDHAHAPYGQCSGAEILELTRIGAQRLLASNCRLIILACNTASAIALRTLQREWLPQSGYKGCNILGIIAPTVEAATKVAWNASVQGEKKGSIGVFATSGTARSGVYAEEVHKRCPDMKVLEIACPQLAGAIETGAAINEIEAQIAAAIEAMKDKAGGALPQEIILGCTHYELVSDVFIRLLPEKTHVLSQPEIVAESLAAYLARHPDYAEKARGQCRFVTTGPAAAVSAAAQLLIGSAVDFAPFSTIANRERA